jgi:hypothetical protein
LKPATCKCPGQGKDQGGLSDQHSTRGSRRRRGDAVATGVHH